MITILPRINNELNEIKTKIIEQIPDKEKIKRRTYDRLMEFLDRFCFV